MTWRRDCRADAIGPQQDSSHEPLLTITTTCSIRPPTGFAALLLLAAVDANAQTLVLKGQNMSECNAALPVHHRHSGGLPLGVGWRSCCCSAAAY